MNESVKMSVSPLTRCGDEKAVYVLFSDEGKSLELKLPEASVVKNSGFSEDEISALKEYAINEADYIYSIAKDVNPIKAFMGE